MKTFPRIALVIKAIEQNRDWKTAPATHHTYLFQLRAALNLGFHEPFSDEQRALNDYLDRRRADNRLCDYAWRLYAQSL